MFNLVIVFFRCPWLEGETFWTLLGTSVAIRSLALVRPEEKSTRDFKQSRCRVGSSVHYEKVCVGSEGLVLVNVGFYIFFQMDKAVYRVVLKEFVCESGLQAWLSECQDLVEVFPGDAQISKGLSTTSQHLTG